MKTFFFFLFLAFTGLAQQNDSLLYQIVNIPNDTERVNQLYKTGFDLRNTEPQTAYLFAKHCEEEALKTNSPKHLAKSYNLLGVLFYKKGNFTKALFYQKKSLALNQKAKNNYGIAINQTNLGNIYTDIRNFNLAETYYLQALQTYNALNNQLQIAKCLMNLGVLKHEQYKLEPALQQFKMALKYATEIKDYDLMASCINNVGTIYRLENKTDSALAYFEEALKLRVYTDNDLELADSYNNLAMIYVQQQKLPLAWENIMLADSICNLYDYREAKINVYDTKALYYEAVKDFQLAFYWIKKHHQLIDSIQKLENETEVYDFEENNPIEPIKSSNTTSYSGIGFIIILMTLLIGIPLFLIRYKR